MNGLSKQYQAYCLLKMSSHHTLHLLLTCATGLLAVLLSYYFQGFNGTDKVMEWTSNMFPLWGVSDKASTLPFRWSIVCI